MCQFFSLRDEMCTAPVACLYETWNHLLWLQCISRYRPSLALCLSLFGSGIIGSVIVVLDGELPVGVVVLAASVGFQLSLGRFPPVLTHLPAANDGACNEENGDSQRYSNHDCKTVAEFDLGGDWLVGFHLHTFTTQVLRQRCHSGTTDRKKRKNNMRMQRDDTKD